MAAEQDRFEALIEELQQREDWTSAELWAVIEGVRIEDIAEPRFAVGGRALLQTRISMEA